MVKRKYEVKKPPAKKPLAAVIAEQFAKRGPGPFLPDEAHKQLTDKERRSAIALWKCFYIDGILIRFIYKENEEEEGVHDE